ncbi:nicotinamide-nucleotide adenylyltransferase [Candidatus Micrarchaeota archaeon]|nr:nicotinamide-nucleotide adenylyltransferase [Candidatus Micrarchaeota archaeon]
MKRVLFVGRFQPFHLGHYDAIKKLLGKYDEVIIVIGSAENSLTSDNPLTTGERIDLIRSCLSEEELSRVLLVPIRDINSNSVWVAHLLSYLPSFEAVYTNNDLVKFLFEKHSKFNIIGGFHKKELYNATRIRELIKNGDPSWKACVPKEAVRFLESIRILDRLVRILN